MKPLPLLTLLLICAGCADIPELDGSEPKSVKSADYPHLIPLHDILGAPADPVSEAAEVEQDLTARSEALAKKAQALQNAQIN
ncbi:hypothetical protein [Ruegeria sp. EL01]|uniref:hypothetical protein n=1 Tax=Ruegeria sp. EL01 TaxID=2107578 RepID=UPI000EA8171C|nr:hypothetical protein [Ruegeria sp. EL01]